MLTEYHGDSVAGGTYPALIWKSFMERALPYLHAEPQEFPSSAMPYASPKNVVYRDGRLRLDNGYCRGTESIEYFGDAGPRNVANCLPNEVDVPNVVGQPVREATQTLTAQPLEVSYVYRPAAPRQKLGIVLRQFPARSHLSSGAKVTLVLAKAVHGVIPNLVGLRLDRARKKLERLKVDVQVTPDGAADAARVVAQAPKRGRAAAPGMHVTLAVKGG
jgi:hypothetical protein